MAISQIVQNSLANTISLGAKISSVQIANSTYVVKDDTAVNVGGGYIVITGSGFQSNCSVLIGTNTACSVTFVSSTQIRAQVPAAAAGSYPVYVINGDGGTGIRVNALTYSDSPTWVTTSPLTSASVDSAFSIQLSASGANTYALQSGSSLPSGVTLAANGLLSGTVTGISDDTTYNFTVEAIDAENQESPKALAITISGQYIISRSLRFNSADTAYLTRTPGSTGNRKTWTWSGWLKRSTISNDYQRVFSARGAAGELTEIVFNNDGGSQDCLVIENFVSGTQSRMVTSAVFRDVSAWYHIVVAYDTTQATNSNRVKLWVNNVQQSFGSGTYPTLNMDTYVNSTYQHRVGNGIDYAVPFSGYLAELHFVDGTALTPDTFGKYDAKTGIWVPKTVSGVTYGTNGFYLPFSDNTSTTTLGNDGTANNNDWTLNNFSVTAGPDNDSLVDSPTPSGTDDGSGADVKGSYATLNPLDKGSNGTLSNGNLKFVGSGDVYSLARSTIAFPKTGKWYMEFRYDLVVSGNPPVGVYSSTFPLNNYTSSEGTISIRPKGVDNNYPYWVIDSDDASKRINTTAIVAGSIVQVIYDADNLKVWMGINNTYYGLSGGSTVTVSASDIANGTNPAYTLSASKTYFAGAVTYASDNGTTSNFGQRPFAYTAPSGYKCLVSENITPGIAANTSSTLANSYFGTVLYTADTPGGKTISGLNFQPDLIWIKNRDNVEAHYVTDAVRGFGANKFLRTNSTAAEGDVVSAAISNFAVTSTGFTITDSNYNTGELYFNGRTYVAWCWNAGGSNATNNDGTVTSTVRANQTAGFSIVSFTVQGSGTSTVGHGLGKAPKFMLVKPRTDFQWDVYHESIGKDAYLVLNSTAAQVTSATTVWNSVAPTSTVFSLGSAWASAAPSAAAIAYCWTDIEGFSKFGSYVGNNNADGPFVYLGFRPSFLMVKRVDSGSGENWRIVDTTRRTYNPHGVEELYANSTAAESGSNSSFVDLLSNGFKIRANLSGSNSTGTFIYVAFAESPFKYARAR